MYFLETIVDQNSCRKLAGGLDMPISEKRMALRAFSLDFLQYFFRDPSILGVTNFSYQP
jgi:hypothetical protein